MRPSSIRWNHPSVHRVGCSSRSQNTQPQLSVTVSSMGFLYHQPRYRPHATITMICIIRSGTRARSLPIQKPIPSPFVIGSLSLLGFLQTVPHDPSFIGIVATLGFGWVFWPDIPAACHAAPLARMAVILSELPPTQVMLAAQIADGELGRPVGRELIFPGASALGAIGARVRSSMIEDLHQSLTYLPCCQS